MKDLLSLIQVCNLLDISYSTIIRYRMDEDMNFPKPVRMANKIKLFFYQDDIEN